MQPRLQSPPRHPLSPTPTSRPEPVGHATRHPPPRSSTTRPPPPGDAHSPTRTSPHPPSRTRPHAHPPTPSPPPVHASTPAVRATAHTPSPAQSHAQPGAHTPASHAPGAAPGRRHSRTGGAAGGAHRHVSPVLPHAAAASAVRSARVVRGRPRRLATKPNAMLPPSSAPTPADAAVVANAVTGGRSGYATRGRRTAAVRSASRSSGCGVKRQGGAPLRLRRWQVVGGGVPMSMVVVMAVTMVLAGRREVVGLESCSRGEVVAAARNGGRRQRQATAPQPRRAREAVAASLRKSVDATALRRRLRRRVGVKGETGAARADGAQGKDNLGLGGESRRQGRRTQTRKQRGAAQSATATVCDGGGDRQGRPQRRRCPLPFPHGDTSVWRAATTGRGGDGAASRTGSADRAGGHDTNADDGGGWKMGDGGARFMHPTPLLPPSPTLVPEGGGGGCRSPLLPRVPPSPVQHPTPIRHNQTLPAYVSRHPPLPTPQPPTTSYR